MRAAVNFHHPFGKQTGFTMIELIVVIVILGILAATALPKFVNLGSDARKSVMKGVEGSMRSANAMIYAKAAAAGSQSAASTTIPNPVGAGTISIEYGFAADSTELAKIMDLSPSTDFTNTGTAIRHASAGTPANCQIAYTAATSASAPPAYTATLTGCD